MVRTRGCIVLIIIAISGIASLLIVQRLVPKLLVHRHREWQLRLDKCNAFFDSGDFIGAVSAAQDALKYAQEKFPYGDYRIVDSAFDLGRSLQSLGEFERAAAAFQLSIEHNENGYHRDDVTLAYTSLKLGEVELTKGDTEKAARDLERGLDILRQQREPISENLLKGMQTLASAYSRMERPEEKARILDLIDLVTSKGRLPP